jgi:hypothetical protein
MTVLATVGFGDIAPVTGTARLVVTVQMACGFAFAALVGREFLAAVRRAQADADGAARPAEGRGDDPRTPPRPLRRAGRSRRPDRRLRTPGPGAPRPRSRPPGCRPSGSARGRAP